MDRKNIAGASNLLALNTNSNSGKEVEITSLALSKSSLINMSYLVS